MAKSGNKILSSHFYILENNIYICTIYIYIHTLHFFKIFLLWGIWSILFKNKISESCHICDSLLGGWKGWKNAENMETCHKSYQYICSNYFFFTFMNQSEQSHSLILKIMISNYKSQIICGWDVITGKYLTKKKLLLIQSTATSVFSPGSSYHFLNFLQKYSLILHAWPSK